MKVSAYHSALKKEQKNFRLSIQCRKLIAYMAALDGVNESSFLEVLTRQEALRRKIDTTSER